jgi:endoglucanase
MCCIGFDDEQPFEMLATSWRENGMNAYRVLLALCLLTAIGDAPAAEPTTASNADAFALCRSLRRGINLGNGLEAPREGAWGYRIEDEHLRLIKAAGFDSVRIPIRWSAHAAKDAPFTIDARFFERVDHVLGQAAAGGLVAVVNVHHYDELYRDPDNHLPRLKAIWQQVGERYRDRPATVLFELLNEPNAALDEKKWNAAIAEILPIVRASNPTRGVIVGPARWNNVNALQALELPSSDRALIATFHYYEPFQFTHQGASWAKGSDAWRGRTWTETADELKRLRTDFDKAAAWSKEHNRPIFLGEFGAYSAAEMPSRARWTSAVVREATNRGFSFAYWEFGSGFGAYDPAKNEWRQPLLDALIAKQ